MKVLVTGSHGYIGCIVTRVLRAAGHDVAGLDALLYRGCDLCPVDDASAIVVDIRDVAPRHLQGFDAIVHLAALSNDPLGALDRELTLAINYHGTVRVARAAKAAGVSRFVFSSSCSMYGASAGDAAVDETAPLRPLSAYAESKVRAEEDLAALAADGFAPVSMRNATAYGVSPRLRLDLVLNNLVGWAHTTGRVRILSDGTPWRPLVHVEDVARATLALLEAPLDVVQGEAFNVGADHENYQVRELAEIVGEETGCAVDFAGAGDPDPRSYRVDFSKLARTVPDLALRWTAREGVRELLRAYRDARLSPEEFEGSRFTRLTRLRSLLDSGEVGNDLRWRTPTLRSG